MRRPTAIISDAADWIATLMEGDRQCVETAAELRSVIPVIEKLVAACREGKNALDGGRFPMSSREIIVAALLGAGEKP